MKKILPWLLTLLSFSSFGQQVFEIKGNILDTTGQPLPGVTIKLVQGKDSTFSLTTKTGEFTFSKVRTNTFTIITSYSGLQPFQQAYTRTGSNSPFRIPPIILSPLAKEMEGIVIRSIRPVTIKEDTVEFNADAYKVRDGAPVEDVIKKLPGVTVDKDGNIEASGKKVARVRVNGKDFFGGDVQTATQNIPAELIQNIQVIDDYGDQANVTGIKSGEPETIININTKPNRNKGTFGNATLAGGNNGRYATNLFANHFNDQQQISVLGAVNNTNANLFNFNGGGRGGGARGANFGSDSRGSNNGPGITLSRSIGLNFRDKWGKKLSVYGSYSFSARNTTVASSVFSQDINPLSIRTTQRESLNQNHSENHRLTWNMEYAMDSFNYLKISPYLSTSSGNNWSRSTSEINQQKYYTLNGNGSTSSSHSPNAGGNLFYNHRFARRGRNLSVNFSMDHSNNNADRFSNGTYHNIDSSGTSLAVNDTVQIQDIKTVSTNNHTSLRFSYTEPLNASGTTVLELSHEWNKSATESIRDVTDLADSISKQGTFNDRQSNHYLYQFVTNRTGLSIKSRKEKYNYSIGVQSQPNRLTGNTVGKNQQTTYSSVNWIPSARFVYNFARNNSLTATLDGSAREPNFTQLQPVADSSNLNNVVVGNPALKNELNNHFSVQYNKFDAKAGSSLFFNFAYDKTDNKIVTNRINNATGTGRTVTYLNTDGFFGYNGNASFTKPFANRKYTAGINMAANYDNNISYTDNQKNKGKNWSVRSGANFRLDLENKVDMTLRADYTTYQTTTRYATFTNTTTAQSLNLGLYGKNYFGDLTIGYDFSKLINYGFSSSVNSNPTILNVYTEYRFLKGKMMTVRLQGFDLFNNNIGITRTVNETTITDSRTTRLARYFLLSVNYRLSKFSRGGNKMSGRRERTE
jgi:outer membrane receptor protein involved in Fe transport